jgi:hypothetical protein
VIILVGIGNKLYCLFLLLDQNMKDFFLEAELKMFFCKANVDVTLKSNVFFSAFAGRMFFFML